MITVLQAAKERKVIQRRANARFRDSGDYNDWIVVDSDLICIPWVDSPFPPAFVVDAMCKAFAVREVGEPETKQHGRLVYTLTLTFGECFLDLSFMPASQYQ